MTVTDASIATAINAPGAGRPYALPSPDAPQGPQARRVPEGTVPLVAFEGDAYDCGRAYGDLVAGTRAATTRTAETTLSLAPRSS